MDKHFRDVYMREIEAQATFGLNAIAGLDSVITRLPEAARPGDDSKRATLQQEVFRSIHSFLTHASNLSRLLWPASPRRRPKEGRADYRERSRQDPRIVRAKDLREALDLPEHGHVLRSRRMRDHLEHFDERLDDWQATSVRHNFVQDGIGPITAIAGIDMCDRMRWYDPQAKSVWFRGEKYDLQVYAASVSQIRGAAQAVLAKSFASRLRASDPPLS